MRQLFRRTIRRLLGLQALEATIAKLQQELAETKGGVSAAQGQVGEILSHMIALRHELSAKMRGEPSAELGAIQHELAETKGGVSATQGQVGEILSHMIVLRGELSDKLGATHRVPDNVQSYPQVEVATAWGKQRGELARALDSLGQRCLATESCSKGEQTALAHCYALAADLVTKYWGRDGYPPPDLYPDDDFTLDYAIRHNIFLAGGGDEAEAAADAPRVPWRDLFRDPDCGVFLVLGQSNAANHGERTYSPKHAVYSFDFLRFRCVRANDPLGGSSGNGGSIWSRLGDLLVERGVYRSVLFVPLAFGGNFVTDMIPGGSKHGRTTLALSRLMKALGRAPLPLSAVFWQQGEAEANHTTMSAVVYQAHLRHVVADLRSQGVFAPVFVAASTYCEAGPHPFHNAEQIRGAQLAAVDRSTGFFPGPDVDAITGDGRYDQCHLSDAGLHRCAELWFDALAPRRKLLIKSADH
jgi:hypothetical protein